MRRNKLTHTRTLTTNRQLTVLASPHMRGQWKREPAHDLLSRALARTPPRRLKTCTLAEVPGDGGHRWWAPPRAAPVTCAALRVRLYALSATRCASMEVARAGEMGMPPTRLYSPGTHVTGT